MTSIGTTLLAVSCAVLAVAVAGLLRRIADVKLALGGYVDTPEQFMIDSGTRLPDAVLGELSDVSSVALLVVASPDCDTCTDLLPELERLPGQVVAAVLPGEERQRDPRRDNRRALPRTGRDRGACTRVQHQPGPGSSRPARWIRSGRSLWVGACGRGAAARLLVQGRHTTSRGNQVIVADTDLTQARFGRSRFLAGAGAALTAVAGALWFPQRASATCPYQGCFGYDMCPSCTYSECTARGCYYGNFGCPSGRQCWYACVRGNTYACCDWGLNGFYGSCTRTRNRCICRGIARYGC